MSGASTPCIKLCVIDPVSKLCEGCGRTLAEIAQWGRLSEAERLAIMAALPERLAGPNATETVIASAAKQSKRTGCDVRPSPLGLLRRFAPRNDDS